MREWIVPDNDIGVDGAYFGYQEILRCKDCMHETDNDCPIKWGKTGEDFCSFAERKSE